MKTAIKPSARRTAGQALVETALALGILLLVVLGGIGVLQVQMASYQVQIAARTAVGAAALAGGPSPEAEQTANLVLDSGMGTSSTKALISITCPKGCRRYRPVSVRIIYRVDVWVPVPGLYDQFFLDYTAVRVSEKDLQP